MKLQRSIARVVTTVHEHVVLTAVSVKVTVQHHISPCRQPGVKWNRKTMQLCSITTGF